MEQYHKIQTVFLRDPINNYKTLIDKSWAKPEFELLKDIDWICTEKIDGTNIRILFDGENLEFRGKTDKAEIPPTLKDVLKNTFTVENMLSVFPNGDNVCLYGEGYGKKIQNGGNYLLDRVDFILFDVKIGDLWLTRSANVDIAQKLKINIVPLIGMMNLQNAINLVKGGFKSIIAENENYVAEGLVMKPFIELFNRRGERIVTKIKYKDFQHKK